MSGSVLKRNIIANTIGSIWVLGLGLFLVPVQFKILGPEVVGLLGFVATLQFVFAVFDFGFSPTILREVASDNSPEREISRELIQSVSMIYWIVAIILGISLGLAASWFTQNWITLDQLTPQYAVMNMQLLAIRLFFSWPLALYVNILSGLQKLDIVNVLRVIATTLSFGGGIIILLIWGTLHFFLLWTITISLISLCVHMFVCYRYFPGLSLFPKFSSAPIKRIWRFSLDMNLISILSVVYTQADNMLVSYLLPLKTLGYYEGAYSINRKGLGTISRFFVDAMLPSLAEDYSNNRLDLLRLRFNKYSQILIYLSALPTFVFIFWGYDVLRVWTTLEVAEGAHIALAILSIGFFLNTTVSPFYIVTVATNNTRLPLYLNLASIFVYFPILYFMIINWGINGAALAWLIVNIYYLVVFVPLVSWRVMKISVRTWLFKNFLPFIMLGSVFGIARQIMLFIDLDTEIGIWIVCAIACVIYISLGFFFLDETIRRDIQKTSIRVFSSLRSIR